MKHFITKTVLLLFLLTMSRKHDQIFSPIFFLTTLYFSRNIKFTEKQHGQQILTYINTFFTIIRNIFVISVWYILFRRKPPINDFVDIAVQIVPKLTAALYITAVYTSISSNITYHHLDEIKTLITQNKRWNYINWKPNFNKTNINTIKFQFIPLYIVYFIIYFQIALMQYIVISKAFFTYYSKDELALIIFGNSISALFVSMQYAYANLLHQQYKLLNKEFTAISTTTPFDKNLLNDLIKTYTNINKQHESIDTAFGFYLFCKFVSTYTILTITLYYIVCKNMWPFFTMFWISFHTVDLILVVWFSHQLQTEVILFIFLFLIQ